jgi:cyclohexyl-isocyanide hydratase
VAFGPFFTWNAIIMADFTIGMLVFPGMTNLDFAGPYEVLAKLPGARTHVLWKTPGIVTTDKALGIVADTAFDDCPPLDLLFVPGGPGQIELMDDQVVLDFLAAQGAQAQWVTSVCTGALLLGAAGLLRGYKAATHWSAMDQLVLFGAEAVDRRVVIDRNRVTGGGVTAGIDFGLTLAATLHGDALAQRMQLGLEYNPQPPFVGGHPDLAPAAVVADFKARAAPMHARRLTVSRAAATRLAARA